MLLMLIVLRRLINYSLCINLLLISIFKVENFTIRFRRLLVIKWTSCVICRVVYVRQDDLTMIVLIGVRLLVV